MNGQPTTIYPQPKSAAILPLATEPSQYRSPHKTKFVSKAFQIAAITPPSITSRFFPSAKALPFNDDPERATWLIKSIQTWARKRKKHGKARAQGVRHNLVTLPL